MKYVRAAIVVLVVAISVWLAMPGLLTSNPVDEVETVETSPTVVPVPTPDYGEIAPQPTQTPVPTATAVPRATPVPTVSGESTVSYVMDLWLDGSPNLAGLSPFDERYGRGVNYGQWTGGFFYTGATSKGKEPEQRGWLVSLLNMLYDKEATGQGSVRVLRFCAESMLSEQQQEELKQIYSLDMNALIRDTLTFNVLRYNTDNHLSFFKSLLQTKGDMKPGGGNPYDVLECFYTPNKSKVNNRTTFNPEDENQKEWSWQRETQDSTALAHADMMIDNAIQNYHSKLMQNSNRSSSAFAQDHLYYALNAMDSSRLNVVLVDTLGMPEIDQPEQYTELIANMAARNGGDLSVGQFVFQLDYAGKISSVGGRSLTNGLLWGFENFRYKGKMGDGSLKWSFVQPMPRGLMMLVVGPSEKVDNYTSVLCQRLDKEMAGGGSLSGKRGDPVGKVSDDFESAASFMYNGEVHLSPTFGFKYKYTVMESKDVVEEQSELMTVLSQRLTESGAGLAFIQADLLLEGEEYQYVTTLGNTISEENVPVITTSFNEPLTVAIDLGLQQDDAFTVAEGQYASSVTVVSALQTQSFTLEEIDALSRNGELDLSEGSRIRQDQAYVDENSRIYKYHATDGTGLQLETTLPVVVDGQLQLTLQTFEVPAPGYYWITVEMRSKALAELDNASWNAIDVWMQHDSEAITYDISQGPAVLADFGSSWDYTPNSYELNTYVELDALVDPEGNALTAIAQADSERSKMIHHAWGVNENATTESFPANIPPVFRVFQLNRIVSSIRSGLLDRSGEIDSAPFLTRHFIVCVPEANNTGEQ